MYELSILPSFIEYGYKMNAIQETKSNKTEYQRATENVSIKADFRERLERATSATEREKIHADFIAWKTENEKITLENRRTTLVISIMANNRKIILANEIKPYIIDALQAFNGKKYGEKTKQAFKDYLIKKTRCAVYLNNDSLAVVPLDKDGYSRCYDIELIGDFLTNDNKINGTLTVDDITHYYGDFVQDIDGYINELINAYNTARNLHNEYASAREKYNHLARIYGVVEISYNSPSFNAEYLNNYWI